MEKKRIKIQFHRPLSKLKLPSERKQNNDSHNKIETCKLSKSESHLTSSSCSPSCNCRPPNKPKYNFSDESSEDDDNNVTSESVQPHLKDSNLKWHGKILHLKKVKVQLKRLRKDSVSIPIEESFHTCVSSFSNHPKEQYTRKKLNSEKSFGTSLDVHSEVLVNEHSSSGGNDVNEYREKNNTLLSMNKEGSSNVETGQNLSIQDDIIKAVQNKTGRKIMSEESEAFFWDWILQKE